MIWKINDTNGNLVTDFGLNGILQLDNFASTNGYSDVSKAIFDNNGKILLTGNAYNGVNSDLILARINLDGNLDNTFGTNGKLSLNALRGYNGDDYGFNLTVSSKGTIYVVGRSYSSSSTADGILIRID